MVNQIQWAGYGAALAAFGLVLIWQGNPKETKMKTALFDLGGKVCYRHRRQWRHSPWHGAGLAEAGAGSQSSGATKRSRRGGR
jgi:hypothetical protein